MQSYESHAHHPVPTYIATVLWLGAAVAFAGTLFFGWDAQTAAFGLLLGAVLVNISIERLYTTKETTHESLNCRRNRLSRCALRPTPSSARCSTAPSASG